MRFNGRTLTEADHALSEHHASITSHRYGANAFCRCGWAGGRYRNERDASAAWAEHVSKIKGEE